MDGEVQRFKRCADPGEGAGFVQRVHENLGRITDGRFAGLPYQHQRASLVVVVCDGLGMPSNIFGALSEKIVFAPRRPEPFELVF